MKIRDRIKEFRRVPASDLAPNPKNWRTHPKEQMDAIRGVLADVGFAGAHLARELPDGSLQLIDGHARAEIVGDAVVPVLVTDLTEAESDLVLATFDPIGAMASADGEKLEALLRDVSTGNEALATMLEGLAEEHGVITKSAGEVVEDEIPEVPADPITKPGDLWILGEHRLLCGDSTKAEDVARLMAGAKAGCLITDPPYGIDWQGSNASTLKWEGIQNDTGQLNLFPILSAYDVVVSFGANCYPHQLPHRGRWIVWDKRVNENADRMIGSPFELAWSSKSSGFDKIYRIMHGGVVNADGHNARREHPTQKPIKLLAAVIEDYADGLILDLFLGSGTTLLAAEQLNRKCYGMEISPAYCDVIVKRWENLTGEKAVLTKG